MDISHITSQSLRRLLSLTDKKDKLIKAVSDIEDQIAKALAGAAAPVAKAVKRTKAKAASKKAKSTKGPKASKAGGLKERILALLDQAGPKGLRVKEIADKLGVKNSNISVWFSTTGRAITTKIEQGRYALKGGAKTAPAVSSPAPVAKPAAAAKPAGKPAKKKSGLTPAGRAKLAAAMKARWEAKKAGKPAKAAKPAAKAASKPAAKPFKLGPKKG